MNLAAVCSAHSKYKNERILKLQNDLKSFTKKIFFLPKIEITQCGNKLNNIFNYVTESLLVAPPTH